MKTKSAALMAGLVALGVVSTTSAQAQYVPGSPWFSEHGMIGSIPNVVSRFGPAYGAPAYRIRPRIGGRGMPPDYCPPGQPVSRSRPVAHTNPKYPGGGYRCWVRTGEPAPGSGDGYCVRN